LNATEKTFIQRRWQLEAIALVKPIYEFLARRLMQFGGIGMNARNDVWLQASSATTQRIEQDNVAQVVRIDRIDGARNVDLDTSTGAITIKSEADYLVVAAPQVGRLNPGNVANFRCWIRLNGVNVPDSNVLLNLESADAKDVIVCQVLVHLSEGDNVEVMMATDNAAAGVGIEALQPTPDEPMVPAIIFSLEARYQAG
jgi:hypothetical protein